MFQIVIKLTTRHTRKTVFVHSRPTGSWYQVLTTPSTGSTEEESFSKSFHQRKVHEPKKPTAHFVRGDKPWICRSGSTQDKQCRCETRSSLYANQFSLRIWWVNERPDDCFVILATFQCQQKTSESPGDSRFKKRRVSNNGRSYYLGLCEIEVRSTDLREVGNLICTYKHRPPLSNSLPLHHLFK